MTKISPTLKVLEGNKILTVAGGCFWGVDHIFRKHFNLTDYKVGYANGDEEHFKNPTYKTVCGGNTNYAEALQVSYDPKKVTLRELVEFFFRIHDPTTQDRQGKDTGTQYRSAVYVNNLEELKEVREIAQESQKKWYPKDKIVTQIELLNSFYDAEDYHQKYLIINPTGYACPNHFLRTTPKI